MQPTALQTERILNMCFTAICCLLKWRPALTQDNRLDILNWFDCKFLKIQCHSPILENLGLLTIGPRLHHIFWHRKEVLVHGTTYKKPSGIMGKLLNKVAYIIKDMVVPQKQSTDGLASSQEIVKTDV